MTNDPTSMKSSSVTNAEAELLLDLETKKIKASTAIRQRKRAANVFTVVTIVGAEFLVCGMVATQIGEVSRFLVGGLAGAAFGLAALAYGECRQLRLGLDALIALQEGSS